MRENFQTWRKETKFFVWGKQFLNIFCALTDLTLWNQRKLLVGFLKFCNQSKFYRNRYRRTLKRWTFRSSWVFTWFTNQQNKKYFNKSSTKYFKMIANSESRSTQSGDKTYAYSWRKKYLFLFVCLKKHRINVTFFHCRWINLNIQAL